MFAARHDDDPFNRWNAINGLFMRAMKDTIADIERSAATSPVDPQFLAVIESVAKDDELDLAYRALCITPPTVNEIARDLNTGINPSTIHAGREHVLDTISVICGGTFGDLFDGARIDGSFEPTAAQAGARSFVGTLLSYLARTTPGIDLVAKFVITADNMTDKLTALSILAHQFPGHSNTIKALADFREAYASEPMVLDKWLSVQATVPSEETLTDVKALANTPIFSWKNPNRTRALLGAFATGNPVGFNRPDGEAYAFFCESILRLDAINPQVSARLMTAMRSWKDLEPVRQSAAETHLRKLYERSELSRDLRDILSRTLGETNAN